MQFKIGRFMPSIGAPPFQVGRWLHFLMLDFLVEGLGTYKPSLKPKALGVFKL